MARFTRLGYSSHLDALREFAGRQPPVLTLELAGWVRRDMEASSASLDFGEIIAGQSKVLRFRLIDYRGEHGEGEWFETVATHPWITQQFVDTKTVVDPVTAKPVHQILVEVQAAPPIDLAESLQRGKIAYTDFENSTESGDADLLTVPFTVRVRTLWQAEPGRLFFGVMSPNSSATKVVALRGAVEPSMAVLAKLRDSKDGCLQVRRNSEEDGAPFLFDVTLKAPKEPGTIESDLEISCKGFPTLKIPVLALVVGNATGETAKSGN